MKIAKARLPICPSQTLIKFAAKISSSNREVVVDAPCGYGRNAVALAARGCTVIAIDNDERRLATLDHLKAAYVAEYTGIDAIPGQILTVRGDLTAQGWPVASSAVSAIVCVHYDMKDLIPRFLSSLKVGGYMYIETFGGQGQNYLGLPIAGELRTLLSGQVEFKYYKERRVGPREFDRVAVALFAQRR